MEWISSTSEVKIITAGIVIIAILFSFAAVLAIIIGTIKRGRLKVGNTELSLGDEMKRLNVCDCAMRPQIQQTHRVVMALVEAVDVLLMEPEEKANGERKAARLLLKAAVDEHDEVVESIAFGGDKHGV